MTYSLQTFISVQTSFEFHLNVIPGYDPDDFV